MSPDAREGVVLRFCRQTNDCQVTACFSSADFSSGFEQFNKVPQAKCDPRQGSNDSGGSFQHEDIEFLHDCLVSVFQFRVGGDHSSDLKQSVVLFSIAALGSVSKFKIHVFFLCRYHCQLVSYTQYKGQSFLSSRFLFFLRCWQSSLILSHCIFESMKFSFCT